MRAYLLSGPGRLGLDTVPDPVCGPDEVTLRTESVSLCSTDISYFRGHLFPDAWPIIPGHEYVGRAVQVGADLRGVIREGDRVCYWGQTDFGGLADYRTIRPLFAADLGASQETSWYTERHFYDAHQAAAVVVPSELPGHLATVVEPLTSVLRSLLVNAPKPGDDCVLLGCGPSGLLALQVMLRYFGVRSVTVFDLDDARLARAAAAGATTVFNLGRQVPEVEAMIAEHQDRYADYVFDALPHVDAHDGPDARELAMGLLRPGGDYVVYGATGLRQSISSWMILAKGLRLRATPFDVRAFSMTRSAHVARVALDLITHGVVDAGSVVTSHLSFDDEAAVRDAFENYGAFGGMKPSITTAALPGEPVSVQADEGVPQTSGSLL
ncbi:alcohol dehydrogenase [Streptomyces sulfonofaciens]|uniref:2-deoxy-scyllo-inosamine dehydrogenase n=1 Tax=Streptomyces sulfonofaciens TaxID=68272 RepID=A0A919GHF1_9ACTN|nr:alcohol dehydrogenase catalytic domain-containing protein [Streptomyces sulfonofaciens]GHH84817.1 alcohol dehydrogenase [Streptomyces sulfonofaciens]